VGGAGPVPNKRCRRFVMTRCRPCPTVASLPQFLQKRSEKLFHHIQENEWRGRGLEVLGKGKGCNINSERCIAVLSIGSNTTGPRDRISKCLFPSSCAGWHNCTGLTWYVEMFKPLTLPVRNTKCVWFLERQLQFRVLGILTLWLEGRDRSKRN
jgi:hypothetical protein